MKIKIDTEFESLIPPVPSGDAGELERAILDDGQIFEPLVVWSHENILLDGHRRHRLTLKHPSLKMPKPVVLDLPSRQEAHDWIINHQLSKRNVSAEQRKYLIGKLYLDTKKPVGKPNCANVAQLESGKTAEKIADSHGVSERTVHNSAEFAEAIDAVPELKAAVLAGEVKATTRDLEALAEMPAAKRKAIAKKVTAGEASVKEAVAEAKPKPQSKNGKPKCDPKQFVVLASKIGECERMADRIAREVGQSDYHANVIEALKAAIAEVEDWKKAV